MITQILQVRVHKETDEDRAALSSAVSTNPEMGANSPLVYIYSLTDSAPCVPYPRGPGRTIYIGETCRETGSWRRFPAHFSPSPEEGLSTLINHTLSTYYHSGEALDLRIFKVNDGRSTKEAERIMLRAHLHRFGACPLGQGGTGKDNTPKEVSRLFSEQRELHEICSELFACAL